MKKRDYSVNGGTMSMTNLYWSPFCYNSKNKKLLLHKQPQYGTAYEVTIFENEKIKIKALTGVP